MTDLDRLVAVIAAEFPSIKDPQKAAKGFVKSLHPDLGLAIMPTPFLMWQMSRCRVDHEVRHPNQKTRYWGACVPNWAPRIKVWEVEQWNKDHTSRYQPVEEVVPDPGPQISSEEAAANAGKIAKMLKGIGIKSPTVGMDCNEDPESPTGGR